jgi:hypothetical protein
LYPLRKERARAPQRGRKEPKHSVIVNTSESAEPFKRGLIRDVHPSPRKWPGMEYRSSCSWFESDSSVSRKFHSIPYVSKSGKFSIYTLYLWKAYPQQVIMSLISTVFARLLKIWRKRFGILYRGDLNTLLKISIVYVLTRDNWVLDRFLGMSRKGKSSKKAARGFTHFCVSKLDGDKRFVYSQAYKHANWLKFQVFRPSDKSREMIKCGSHLRNNFKDMDTFDNGYASSAFQISTDFWEVHKILSMDREGIHYDSSSEFPDNLSELAKEIAGFSEDDY